MQNRKRKLILERLDDWRWRIPRRGPMRSDGLIFADETLARTAGRDGTLQQVADVASLPGIVGPAMAMPDFHQGYGFPIGGVAAFDAEGEGIVSPGGVGYDINCGVRLLRTRLDRDEMEAHLDTLMVALLGHIPAGVGSRRPDLKLAERDLDRVLAEGVDWAVGRGLAGRADTDRVESGGCIAGADPDRVSGRAKQRGHNQLGTLGSGNHFVEIDAVTTVYDAQAADALGLAPEGVAALIHTGSRGLGHQVCSDAIRQMARAAGRYGIRLPDRQLCCAPLDSDEGRGYLAAMAAAANYAFANRAVISHWLGLALEQVFGRSAGEIGLGLVYDVTHNMAKLETHQVEGRRRRLCVHRKGATRAFAPGHPELPAAVRPLGQPVLIPGDMGRCSYVLLGTEGAMRETFGSCCHGAGRELSRKQARLQARGRSIAGELLQRGIHVQGASRRTLDEELSEAYKDVDRVVDVVCGAGLARRVARLEPLGVVKG